VDGDARAAATRLGSGATPVDVAELPAEPYDLRPARLIVAVDVTDDESARQALLAAVRGVDVVARVTLPGRQRLDFLAELARVADVQPADASAWERLGDEQRELLRLLATGRTLDAAADRLGWSRRTATRRLSEAKEILRVTTTAEAVQSVPTPPPSS
jgi:DNA-binding NarL/FixJ family response regulator